MKRLVIFALFSAVFCLSTNALAEMKELGPDYARYTIEVPKGWNISKEKDKMIAVTNPEKTASLAILIEKLKGLNEKDLEDIAKSAAKHNGTDKIEKKDNTTYYADWKVKGVDYRQYFMRSGDLFITFVLAGERKDLESLVTTFKLKK